MPNQFPAPVMLDRGGTMPAPKPRPMQGASVVDQPTKSMAQIALAAAARAREAGDQEAYAELMAEAQADMAREGRDSVVAGESGPRLFLEGMGRGMVNVVRHGANLARMGSSRPAALEQAGVQPGMPATPPQPAQAPAFGTDEDIAQANVRDQPLLDTNAGAAGSFTGEVATLAPMGGPVTGAAARVGAPVARALSKPIVRGAFEGAAQGGLMADPGEKMEGMLGGGLAGAALPAAAAGGSKAMRGMTRTPEADALLREGVDLTPGQMNPRGLANQVEETATSLPGQGPMVRGAREQSRDQFAQAAMQRGAAPGSKLAPGTASDMLNEADATIAPLYDAAKGFPLVLAKGKPVIVNQGANEELGARFLSAVTQKKHSLKARKEAQRFLENEFGVSFKQTDDLIKLRSNIRTEKRAQRNTASPTADTRAVAEILEDAEKSVTEAIESQIPVDAAASLRQGDQAYRQLMVLQDAANRGRGQTGGLFTPAQLDAAVHDSMPERTYTRMQPGQNELHDLAKQGRNVFEARAPVTGARLLTLPNVPIARDLAAAPFTIMAATKGGRRLAQGRTAVQQKAQAIADAVAAKSDPSVRKALAATIERAIVTSATQNSQVRE